jgi:hypothetical protein
MDDIFFVVCWTPSRTQRLRWARLRAWRKRHALERGLDTALRTRALGWVDGAPGRREILVVVHRDTWLAAWEAMRATLEKQGLLRRPGPGLHITLHDTLYDGPPRTLWPLPQDVWQLDRLTRADLACLVDHLATLVDRALIAYLHLDLLGHQAVLDTAADAVDALQELFNAALAAWRATLELDVQPAASPDLTPDI